MGNIVVAERNGTPILARDVTTVSVGSVPRQGIAGQDGDDEAVTGIVVMRKGENPSDVLAVLKSRIADLNASLLPKGVAVAQPASGFAQRRDAAQRGSHHCGGFSPPSACQCSAKVTACADRTGHR